MVNVIKFCFLTFVFLFHPLFSFSLVHDDFENTPKRIFFDGKELVMESGIDSIFFGKCHRGSSCSVNLTVINQSDITLWITNVRGSCGLSVPVWPRDEINPGKSGIIQIRFDSQRMGEINRNLTIHSNTFEGSTVLSVTGQVIQGP